MSQLLTLSRAARLIGVSRAVLQKRIKEGELASFDGMVTTEDLLKAYPSARLEDDAMLERLTVLKEEAFGKRVRERALPNALVLAERLFEQSRELADVRTHLQRYHAMVTRLQERIEQESASAAKEVRQVLARLAELLQRELEQTLGDATPADALSVMDDMLKVMSAHVVLHPSRHEFFVEGSDSILDAALRAGIPVNFGCSSGGCGLCKARVVSGQVKKIRHHDYQLSEVERIQGYCLLCCHTPVSDLVIEALEAGGPADIPEQQIAARVKTAERLGDRVMLLHLQTPRSSRLRFLAGQSATLGFPAGGEAVLPIASCPCDDRNIQFHLDREAGEAFTEQVFAGTLRPGDTVTVRGPWGDFILRKNSQRPLVFISCDTGFAPIKSLVEHAMAADESERIHLYRLATRPDGHYLANLCRAWADALDNFRYTALTAEREGNWGRCADTVVGRLAEDYDDLSILDVYVAGPEGFVGEVARGLSLRGVAIDRLSACVV